MRTHSEAFKLENPIRPIALRRKNWLFAGSLRAGQGAAAIISLIQSAQLNGHGPFAYLKSARTAADPEMREVFERIDAQFVGQHRLDLAGVDGVQQQIAVAARPAHRT
ncbi:transposase IS66 [Thauera sp. 63]|nr:transposase IS66 [Thauera sp. 63]